MTFLRRFIAFLYVILVFSMAFATLIERLSSTAEAHHLVYGAWWFSTMWGLLLLSGLVFFSFYLKHSGRRRITLLGLHVSLSVILIGAFVTHQKAVRGEVYLRSGDVVQQMNVRQENGCIIVHHLPFQIQLDSFYVVRDNRMLITDYVSCLSFHLDKEEVKANVAINKVTTFHGYRFCQSSCDDEFQGTILSVNYDPIGIPLTYAGYACLFLSLLAFLLTQKHSCVSLLYAGTVGALWCVYYFFYNASWRTIPVLRHPLLAFHVLTIIFAYALFLVLALQSARALLWKNDHISLRPLLNLALSMLSIGVFVGAIWANISWGAYWSWDAKETWALITLMVYAVPAHRPLLGWLRKDHNYHAYLLGAFVFILFTYFGVNHLLSGLHSYL